MGYTRVAGTPMQTAKTLTFGIWAFSGTPLGGSIGLFEVDPGTGEWLGHWFAPIKPDSDVAAEINSMGLRNWIKQFLPQINQAIYNVLNDYNPGNTTDTTVVATTANWADLVNTDLHNGFWFQVQPDGNMKLVV